MSVTRPAFRHATASYIRLASGCCPSHGRAKPILRLRASIKPVRRAAPPPRDRPIPVSAWFLHAEIGHQFAARWQPRVSARIDIASGDRAGARYTRFDTLFGVRRLDFGPTGLFGPLGRNNIISPGVKLDVTPDKRWDGFIAYRAALLESATDSFSSTGIRDPSGRSGRFAGHQIEARARYWMVPQRLRVDVGAATLINGEFLQRAANANRRGNPLYGYVDLTVTF